MGLLSRRDPDNPSDVVVELDRWQLTGLLLAVFVFCALAFAVGMSVGEERAGQTASAPRLTLDPAPSPAARDRQLSLAEAAPNLAKLQLDASREVGVAAATSPAELARMATHRALHEAREGGVGHLSSPTAAAPSGLAAPAPSASWSASGAVGPGSTRSVGALAPGAGTPGHGQPEGAAAPAITAHALSVATVSSEASAAAMKDALAGVTPKGVPISVRALPGPAGPTFRVEVGRFRTASEAAAFQKRFQSESGYLVTVVGVP